jgi:hypothetical protein
MAWRRAGGATRSLIGDGMEREGRALVGGYALFWHWAMNRSERLLRRAVTLDGALEVVLWQVLNGDGCRVRSFGVS